MRRQNDARECLRKRLLEPGHTPATPRNQPHIARGSAAAGRCLQEREGRFASFLTPAPSGTDLPPLATQHAGKIGSRFQSVERKVTQHFIASMSVRLHRIRCSACSGFGVHDGWNTHLRARAKITTHSWTPMHPVWLRCSSVIYPDIIHFSRLARRAPRRPRMGIYSCPSPNSSSKAIL